MLGGGGKAFQFALVPAVSPFFLLSSSLTLSYYTAIILLIITVFSPHYISTILYLLPGLHLLMVAF